MRMHRPPPCALVVLLLAPAGPALAEVQVQPFSPGAAPARLWARGKHVGGLRWKDREGESLLLLVRRDAARPRRGAEDPERSSYLYARHWTRAGAGAFKLRREVKDMVERCPFDVTAEFVDRALGVTDLDRDGVGEVTFAYRLGCRSDVSPVTLKLLMLEGGRKHILRGETSVPISRTERAGGRYQVDASFRSAPKAFLSHAVQLWRRVAPELD